jgi:hypothetical protein
MAPTFLERYAVAILTRWFSSRRRAKKTATTRPSGHQPARPSGSNYVTEAEGRKDRTAAIERIQSRALPDPPPTPRVDARWCHGCGALADGGGDDDSIYAMYDPPSTSQQYACMTVYESLRVMPSGPQGPQLQRPQGPHDSARDHPGRAKIRPYGPYGGLMDRLGRFDPEDDACDAYDPPTWAKEDGEEE